jgi:hypothetical protein
MQVFFTGSRYLEEFEPIEISPPDPTLAEEVNRALELLPGQLQQIMVDRVYQGMTISQLAHFYGISEKEAGAALYEAKRQLRAHLADFVYRRWKIRAHGGCRFCGHPKSDIIEKMLEEKSDRESWGMFGRRLSKVLGEKINPPRLLIAHSNHIKSRKLKNE